MTKPLKCPGLERALVARPETFHCVHCGAEVEIWSDEKRARCSACRRLVGKTFSIKFDELTGKPRFMADVRELKDQTSTSLYYELYQTVVPLSSLGKAGQGKIGCEACHKFGRNFACPPHSPYLQEYLDSETHAKVICVRMPQEYFAHTVQENAYEGMPKEWSEAPFMPFRDGYRKTRNILVEELMRFRSLGYLVAGSGFCLACETCPAEDGGESCIAPIKRIYSLESLGVNLTHVTKACFDFELDWSWGEQGFICAIGAVFFSQNQMLI